MQLTGELSEDMSIYRVWFLSQYPDFIDEQIKLQLQIQKINYEKYATKNKIEFYKELKEALALRKL